MARIDDIDRRLLNWARWKLGQGSGGLGYGSGSYFEAGGYGYREAVIPTVDCEADETNRAVLSLDETLQATVTSVYVGSGSLQRKAVYLGVSVATVHARTWDAHRRIAAWLVERKRAADEERRRVERLMR